MISFISVICLVATLVTHASGAETKPSIILLFANDPGWPGLAGGIRGLGRRVLGRYVVVMADNACGGGDGGPRWNLGVED